MTSPSRVACFRTPRMRCTVSHPDVPSRRIFVSASFVIRIILFAISSVSSTVATHDAIDRPREQPGVARRLLGPGGSSLSLDGGRLRRPEFLLCALQFALEIDDDLFHRPSP